MKQTVRFSVTPPEAMPMVKLRFTIFRQEVKPTNIAKLRHLKYNHLNRTITVCRVDRMLNHKRDGDPLCYAYAMRNPEDEQRFCTGARFALQRALDRLERAGVRFNRKDVWDKFVEVCL